MNCDICGKPMIEWKLGWVCPVHYIRISAVEKRKAPARDYMILTVGVCLALLAAVTIWAVIEHFAGKPVAPYSLCEQCGEMITAANQGHCHKLEVATCR